MPLPTISVVASAGGGPKRWHKLCRTNAGEGVYDRCRFVCKAASYLAMKTEERRMARRLNKARSESVANTTCENKIVVPFAFLQNRT